MQESGECEAAVGVTSGSFGPHSCCFELKKSGVAFDEACYYSAALMQDAGLSYFTGNRRPRPSCSLRAAFLAELRMKAGVESKSRPLKMEHDPLAPDQPLTPTRHAHPCLVCR